MPRIVEFLAALFALVVAAVPVGVLILLVRRDSPGPGVFRQLRVGRGGETFLCYKLRTMSVETPSVPTHDAPAGYVTSMGRMLRATKLDELPQLWNVLLGQMSFVGPRPCLPSQATLIAERQKRGVLAVRPGITGLAQIRGIDMSDPVRLAEVDADYVRTKSLAADMRILFLTVFGGAGRGDRIRGSGPAR